MNAGTRLLPCLVALATLATTCVCSHLAEPNPVRASGPVPQWKNDWSRGAVFYEVFVRSYYDSNGDGIGDLKGLIAKLDYLNDGKPQTSSDLGVDALWLMPIFKSPSYHGYDALDYRQVNPDYGKNADMELLLKEAHRRGIRVILDLVMNHTGSDHPWFVESSSSPASARREWYVWSKTDPGWMPPWGGTNQTWHPKNGYYYYGVFWSGMPDLNYRTQAVRKEMKLIAKYWLGKGVDGFRLDAARHLIENGAGQSQVDTPETHAFWKELSTHVRKVKPEATLVGENWTDTPIIATYFGSTAVVKGGDEFPMNFDFPLASSIIQGVNASRATGIAAKIAEVKSLYPAGSTDAPFLTNHDNVRLATQLGANTGKLRNAAAILLTVPGSPFVYYGEEVGVQNGTTSGDEAKRTPMPWDASDKGGFTTGTPWYQFAPGKETANVALQKNDPSSLLAMYRNLIAARKRSTALTKGGIELLTATTGASSVLAYVRTDGAERVLVAHNLSDTFAVGGPYAISATTAEKLFAYPSVTNPTGGPGSWSIALPPRATGVWRME
ncbi:MAG: alpha-amylase family glycosyl hydrolase [Acidobacteriota bacterium]